MGILVGSGNLTMWGSLVVIMEYVLLISAIAWIQPHITRSSRR